jgi:hypothetical protein
MADIVDKVFSSCVDETLIRVKRLPRNDDSFLAANRFKNCVAAVEARLYQQNWHLSEVRRPTIDFLRLVERNKKRKL